MQDRGINHAVEMLSLEFGEPGDILPGKKQSQGHLPLLTLLRCFFEFQRSRPNYPGRILPFVTTPSQTNVSAVRPLDKKRYCVMIHFILVDMSFMQRLKDDLAFFKYKVGLWFESTWMPAMLNNQNERH